MIKEQVFVYISCMNVCKQLYVDIDIAKNMKRVYTISERLNSCYCYYCGLYASFLSFRTHKNTATKSSWPYACCKNVQVK